MEQIWEGVLGDRLEGEELSKEEEEELRGRANSFKMHSFIGTFLQV